MRRNAEKRLGASESDAADVKRHPYFRVSHCVPLHAVMCAHMRAFVFGWVDVDMGM